MKKQLMGIRDDTAKNGDLDILKVLIEAIPEFSINTTVLHTAAAQGHIEVVNFLLDKGSNLVTIAKNNGKTALHSAARYGHVEVVRALLSREPELAMRTDKKGQTALHMAVKGQNLMLVEELLKSNPSLINTVDAKGNTPLHTATRKGHLEIILKLLDYLETDANVINKSGETALDTAEKKGLSEIFNTLQVHGVQSAKPIKSTATNTTIELQRTVSGIKAQRRVQGVVKRLNRKHALGLNNAINSNTVVAVLIATVAYAAIFSIPGQYSNDSKEIASEMSPGEANVGPKHLFMVFIFFDSTALFISLAVVVVQTSVVAIEKKAKKLTMAIMNKLMWLSCVLISVAFLAMSFIVVGDQKWLAMTAAAIGTVIIGATMATLCHRIIAHRLMRIRFKRINFGRSVSTEIMLGSASKQLYAI